MADNQESSGVLEMLVGSFLREVSFVESQLTMLFTDVMGLDRLAGLVISKNMDFYNFWSVFLQYLKTVTGISEFHFGEEFIKTENDKIQNKELEDYLKKLNSQMGSIRSTRNRVAHGTWCLLNGELDLIILNRDEALDYEFQDKLRPKQKIGKALQEISQFKEGLVKLKNMDLIKRIIEKNSKIKML